MFRVLLISPILLFLTGSTWLFLVVLMARARVQPPRLTALKALFSLGRASPADIGFAYEPLSFDVPFMGKALRLKAAYVPHAAARGRLVVVLHGFADSSAGAAAWLPMLHECEANVLLLDLPGHGESGDALSTAGFHERYAVVEVLQQIRAARPDDCRSIALFGISMGAAVALSAACLPGANVSAVVVDSPYAQFRSAATLHARLFGLPGRFVQGPATTLIETWLKIDYSQVAPLRIIADPPCPVLLIQSGDDALISERDAAALRAKVAGRSDGQSRVLVIERAPHILGLATDPATYTSAVRWFLKATLPS